MTKRRVHSASPYRKENVRSTQIQDQHNRVRSQDKHEDTVIATDQPDVLLVILKKMEINGVGPQKE